jgi:hypothetical protein
MNSETLSQSMPRRVKGQTPVRWLSFDGFNVSHDAGRHLFHVARHSVPPVSLSDSVRLQTKLSANEWPQGAPVSASTKPG